MEPEDNFLSPKKNLFTTLPKQQRNAKKNAKGKIRSNAVILNEASDTEAFNSPASAAVSASAPAALVLPSPEGSPTHSRPSTPIEQDFPLLRAPCPTSPPQNT